MYEKIDSDVVMWPMNVMEFCSFWLVSSPGFGLAFCIIDQLLLVQLSHNCVNRHSLKKACYLVQAAKADKAAEPEKTGTKRKGGSKKVGLAVNCFPSTQDFRRNPKLALSKWLTRMSSFYRLRIIKLLGTNGMNQSRTVLTAQSCSPFQPF